MTRSKGVTSAEYLSSHLPRTRRDHEWAPELYAEELAHIDAILSLIGWATSSDRPEWGLIDVLNQFARGYGWSDIDTDNGDGATET